MKKSTDTAMNTAAELLAERRKYEGWLAALHQRRETTPPHVYTRVLADYEARLQAVVSELTSKADALDARVAELMKRASALEDDARAVHDQRAEAELRAHVGELEGAAWEKAAQDADARLGMLGEERGAVEKELASIRDLLGAARQPTPAHGVPAVDAAAGEAAGASGSSAPRPAPADAQHDAFAVPAEAAAGGDAPIVTEPVEAGGIPASKPTRSTGSFDELAFLRDVAGEGEGAGADPRLAPPRQATVPIKPAPASGEESGTDAAALAAPQPAAQAAPQAATPPEPELEPDADTHPRPERPIKDTLGLVLPDERSALPARRSSTEIPMAANVTGNAPIILETGGKQNKTLKCTDCGSMNYPTEWYCGRCGAELSAL